MKLKALVAIMVVGSFAFPYGVKAADVSTAGGISVAIQEALITSQERDSSEEEVAIEPETDEPSSTNSCYYSEDNLYWLSHLIMAEMEGETYENKVMTGLVVMNRVRKMGTNNVYDVIFEKGQYACVGNGRIYLTPNEECERAAFEILTDSPGIAIPANVLYQAEFRQGSGVYAKVGNTYYCYE